MNRKVEIEKVTCPSCEGEGKVPKTFYEPESKDFESWCKKFALFMRNYEDWTMYKEDVALGYMWKEMLVRLKSQKAVCPLNKNEFRITGWLKYFRDHKAHVEERDKLTDLIGDIERKG